MNFNEIKSFAKINLALNVTGKTSKLHKIESLVAFIDLHDLILIKKINSKNHQIIFSGKFSKNISPINTVSRLFRILDEKKLIRHKFLVKIKKNIPQKAGLGGGSMNAASILKFLIEKKIVKISIRKIQNIARDIGSDVILGMSNTNTILTSKNEIRTFKNCRKLFTLIVKPNFGCSTKHIYSKVRKFDKAKFLNPKKKMLNIESLKKKKNSLEKIVLNKYPKLKKIKKYLERLEDPIFVRMTGSGSALVSYYYLKKQCNEARKKFKKDYKKYWCISSKTI
tara:strand:+ start:2298 stop:3140 length:843 start_codon:yes stop_codon:yes gene_type:complete